jgi:hypothetical protein
MSQVCRFCKIEKPLDQFYPDQRRKLGVKGECMGMLDENPRKIAALIEYLATHNVTVTA